jgi:hypothetical protein
LKILGIDGGRYKPRVRDKLKHRGAALLAAWLNEQHAKAGAMLRELSRGIAIAEEAGKSTLTEQWGREFSILEILFDDLQQPEFGAEFLRAHLPAREAA